MIIHRSEGLAKLLILTQVALAIPVFWLCSLLVNAVVAAGGLASPVSHQWIYCGVLIFGLMTEAFVRDSTKLRVRLLGRNPFHSHTVALRQTIFAAVALLGYLTFAKDTAISRSLLAVLFPSLHIMLVAADIFVPRWLARHMLLGIREERTVIVGDPEKLHAIKPWLACKAALGFRTLGVVCEPVEDEATLQNFDHLGSTEDLPQIIEQHRPTQILLLQIPNRRAEHRRILEHAENHGLRVLILNTLADQLEHPVIHFEDDGCQLIGLRPEPLENPFNRSLKRLLDICVALPVVLFVLPFLSAIVWIAQRRQARGPLFYLQERAGIQNTRFYVVKFRTMFVSNSDEARQATSADERVYPLGRILRKLSLDELPQFWNVLIGEMSVVGPRPHMIEHNEIFARQFRGYHTRAFVKPGITGLAQVRGYRGEIRCSTDLNNRLRSDVSYVESWTLMMDVVVIICTAWQVIFPPRTAY